jgi:hypothetical protein
MLQQNEQFDNGWRRWRAMRRLHVAQRAASRLQVPAGGRSVHRIRQFGAAALDDRRRLC